MSSKLSSLCCYLLLSLSMTAFAQSNTRSKNQKIRNLERQHADMQRKMKETDVALSKIKKDKTQETNKINLLRKQKAQSIEYINILGSEINALQEEIDTLGYRITSLKREEAVLLEQYVKSLHMLQQTRSSADRWLFVLSAKNFIQMGERQVFLRRYAREASRVAQRLRSNRVQAEAHKSERDQAQRQKQVILAERDREKKKLETEEGKRMASLSQLQGKEKQLSKDLDKYRRELIQLNRRIEAEIEAEIARAEARAAKERERKAAEERKRREATHPKGSVASRDKAPSQPAEVSEKVETDRKPSSRAKGYVMDEGERKISGSFAQNKGHLPAPIRGRYEVVRRFGVQSHSSNSKIQISNGGIDLRPLSDKRAYCIYQGVVSRVFETPGFGRCIIVRHGNYLSVYSNLSSVSVQSGRRVSAGSPLGTISSSGDADRAGVLHFQIWKERTKLNPSSWIKI